MRSKQQVVSGIMLRVCGIMLLGSKCFSSVSPYLLMMSLVFIPPSGVVNIVTKIRDKLAGLSATVSFQSDALQRSRISFRRSLNLIEKRLTGLLKPTSVSSPHSGSLADRPPGIRATWLIKRGNKYVIIKISYENYSFRWLPCVSPTLIFLVLLTALP